MSIEKIERDLRDRLEGVSGGRWSAVEWSSPQWAIKGSGDFEFIALTSQGSDEANAEYIVAAQPENIRALLDELSRLRTRVAELEAPPREIPRQPFDRVDSQECELGAIRICPMRDGPCPHGLHCPYVGDGYMGYPCKEGWNG